VEGASISTIAPVKRKTWNTVYCWLELARAAYKAFNENNLKQFDIKEPQADEIRTFVDDKKKTEWVMTLLETTSRLWPSCLVGKRSYRNIRRLLRDTLSRSECHERLLITTDGFKPYGWVIGRMFGSHCIYGQVIKTYRNGRTPKVKRSLVSGTTCQLEEALSDSEDSTKLNTAFVERHNLSIRQRSAYLQRKSPSHARREENLVGHLELLRCYYNFIRPHMGLRFGTEFRTPAMQAGIVMTKLSFRQVASRSIFFAFRILKGEGRPAFEMAA
jgi:IS1 family transposase